MVELFQIPGILGIIFLISGILAKKKIKSHNPFFILGGISLLIYSYTIGDMIFIMLQVVYIIASVYEFFKIRGR